MVFSPSPRTAVQIHGALPPQEEADFPGGGAVDDQSGERSQFARFPGLDAVEVVMGAQSGTQRTNARGRAESDADGRGEDVRRIRAAVPPVRRRAAGAEGEEGKEEKEAGHERG